MSRLISATILPDTDLAGQTQVELIWESPRIALKDWTALHNALKANDMPMQRRLETRAYASVEMAQLAIDRLMPAKVAK